MKKICIDARLYGVGNTGLGRYMENLIDNLPADPNIQITLILPQSELNNPKLTHFSKVAAKYHPYSLLAQLEMLLLLLRLRPHLLHYTHFSVTLLWPGRFVVTIHDLIKHYSTGLSTTTRNPLVYYLKRLGYMISISFAVHRSHRIFVPSKYWQDQLIAGYHINSDKIVVTYEGVSANFSSPVEPQNLGLPQPYVIYTGNLYPHKNLPVLYKAIGLLKGQVHLGIVCARSVFSDRIPRSPWIHYLGFVPDERLIYLYRQSLAFVFPSLIEGFGLPGLEAMAAGTPVIAAKASCLPEIYGSAAMFFDPTNAQELADNISLLLHNPKLREDLISAGKNQVNKYSWAETARLTWETYLAALP